MTQNTKKRIFIVPLNWGLGHATRLIPVIHELLKAQHEVILGGSREQLKLINKEFPHLTRVSIPFLTMKLSGRSKQVLQLLFQIPGFIMLVIREHWRLKNIISKYRIDIVISDNCYGLWNKNITSIFITHQLNIQLPKSIRKLQPVINKIHIRLIKRFDTCWVPDVPGPNNLAGQLTYPPPGNINLKYIGILSRFNNIKPKLKGVKNTGDKKLLVLLSGPEPQRTIFEKIIIKQYKSITDNVKLSLVRGMPCAPAIPKNGWHNHVSSGKLVEMIDESDYIVCRSGYSTLMDLVSLRKTAFLVPTPGQSEQEYLAGYYSEKRGFNTTNQDEFLLDNAITFKKVPDNGDPSVINKSSRLLHEAILALNT